MAYPGKDWTEDRREGQGQPNQAGHELETRVGAARGRFYGEGRPDDRGDGAGDRDALYFFPTEAVTEARVRWILRQGSNEEKAWVVSHLVRYAQWSDIWRYVSREEVREMLPHLELSDRLRAAWSRMLSAEASVG